MRAIASCKDVIVIRFPSCRPILAVAALCVMLPGVALPAPAALAAVAIPGQASPAADDASARSDARDVERLIAKLEDPEARAGLVSDLKALLDAQKRAAEPERKRSGGGDVMTIIAEMLGDAWDAVVSIDPRQLLTSVGLSLVIAVAALLLRWLSLRLLRRVYARLAASAVAEAEAVVEAGSAAEGRVSAEAAGDGQAPVLPAGIVRLVNLIVAVLAAALIAESWGAGLTKLLQSDLATRLVQGGLTLGLILILTMLAWNISGFVVARLLSLASGSSDTARMARRLDTLVPLLRSVLQGVIGVLAGLLILSELGVDIGPLLAGAGILGLAVGFGAQTLVKDLLTGVTILLEDGATLGDVVQVAGHTGVVEEMRVRTMRLRDVAGAVHLVPYSDVTTIVNYTQDYSYYLLDVGVAYREDTDEVGEALRAVASELRGAEDYRRDILDDLEILGVDKFADSAVVIRARLKTEPGKQWYVGREFNRRMKKLFDQRGIEIPFPHTTLYFGVPKEGLPPAARLAIANAPAESE